MDVIARNNVHVLDTEGPVLLYAHGFGCHQHMWSRITPAFLQSHRQEKWPRLSKQHSPTFKWTAGGLQTVQSCRRRRSALATMRPTRWATRGAPGTSAYAAIAMMVGGCAK